jgi:hypothetical protein
VVEIVKDFAKKNNILAGVCHAAPLEFSDAAQTVNPFVPFVSADVEKRINPAASLRGVKSIVVIGVGCGMEASPPNRDDARFTCEVSSLGVCDDYHVRVKKILRELIRELKAFGDFKYKILVDSPALDERALAQRAGIGFLGRNGLIISNEFGSRFNIGCLLTDIEQSAVKTVPLPANVRPTATYAKKPAPRTPSTEKGFSSTAASHTSRKRTRFRPRKNGCLTASCTAAKLARTPAPLTHTCQRIPHS